MPLNRTLKAKWKAQERADKQVFAKRLVETKPVSPRYRIMNPVNGKVLRGKYTMKQVLELMDNNDASLSDYTLLRVK